MAAPTLGEAIALQGVTKPADNFGALVRGMQTGQMFQQRRQAGDAKVQKMISEGIQVDPASFPTRAHYERAKKDTEEYMMKAYERRKQVGDNRLVGDAEFQQMKTNYLYGIENLKEDAKKAAELDKLNREGKIWVDPDYIKAANSSWDEYASYKNDITGEGVDPVSRRSNVTAVPKVDLTGSVKAYFDPKDESLYSKNIGNIRYGGVNDYAIKYAIDPEQKMARVNQMVVDNPALAERYLKMDKSRVDARAQAILKEQAAKGVEYLDINEARKAAAKEFLMADIDKLIPQYTVKDIRVPEPKSTSDSDGSAKRKDKFQYTPTVLNEEKLTVEHPSISGVTKTGEYKGVDKPFVSVQYSSSETDNKPLDLPVTTADGDVLMEISPLGFTKIGNDWVFMGKNEIKDGDNTELQDMSINMTKNKKAAARIANYFGYEKVSDYIDFLDKKAGVQSTAKPAGTQTKKQKTYKAADLNDKVVATIQENEIVVIDGVERIKQGGVLKKVKR